MRILVIGGGGREHAIVSALSRSAHQPELFCTPGNGGTAELATNVEIDIEDPATIVAWVEMNPVDLVVVGPEVPLVVGLANLLAVIGVPCFGPKAAGAEIEGSKIFAKDLMARHGIPTGKAEAFDVKEDALKYLEEQGVPIVVKADGLAAGKGVTVAMDIEAARNAITACFEGEFGEAGEVVVIEEYLEGPECSLLAFTDGTTVLPMLPAQDHKRAYDGDQGPNTGGMGVYTPVPVVDEATRAEMVSILERTVAGMASEGIDYRGVLYGGFILTADGPKVLEFNARFGDPETQVVLPLLKTDLVDVMLATVEKRLSEITLEWSDDAAVSVVLASGGYPGSYTKEIPIDGVAEANQVPGVTVFHAGTMLKDGALVTNGGRVLNVTAIAPTMAEARTRAYEAADKISFLGMEYRTDIGLKALQALGEA
ncbi:MAG: phosphoribosylamine--glycine ligase [Actinobacteria bacterium HGW-Actinobacteria-1]|jgi:phosphoribosylamine--glycine ligase|nr:MAG: phosphoribosylamine--glycine ligase [Actinobacteria bacterium HGW-Actinobacteria-1]